MPDLVVPTCLPVCLCACFRYQSLNGYDFMLLDLWEQKNPTQHKQLAVLRDVFWAAVAANYAKRRAAATAAKANAGGGAGKNAGGESKADVARGLNGEGGDSDARLDAAVASLKRDVTLLTATHYFTIVPLHETRQRQLLYLQMSRRLLVECELIASPSVNG